MYFVVLHLHLHLCFTQASDAAPSGADPIATDPYEAQSTDSKPYLNYKYERDRFWSTYRQLLWARHRHIQDGHLKGLFKAEFVENVWVFAKLLRGSAMMHKSRSHDLQRAKWVFVVPTEDGLAPLYFFKQETQDYGLLSLAPDPVKHILAEYNAAMKFDKHEEANHVLFLFYENGSQHIPTHQDKPFSKKCKSKQCEDGVGVGMLNLHDVGVARDLIFTTLSAKPTDKTIEQLQPHVVATVPVRHGDVYYLTPKLNSKYKHTVAMDETEGLRCVVTFRHVDRSVVNLSEGTYSLNGGKWKLPTKPFRMQDSDALDMAVTAFEKHVQAAKARVACSLGFFVFIQLFHMQAPFSFFCISFVCSLRPPTQMPQALLPQALLRRAFHWTQLPRSMIVCFSFLHFICVSFRHQLLQWWMRPPRMMRRASSNT